ncbi:hypothetical protein K493DRAFT_360072 [Basidiobolus meristosporus CBS 931.73]|uniref:Uncharacterized protein n=1 Tax=Basidiobolus meristosporus CBS 931.73 TaxID=1314790 RepID=A0A1Y1XLY6_9FUNG|nr:hypothetical protein K493DRAFT_360072 [Basidiobolus meristosporus CBS 931.73]|eukprot:ORX86705.1 hypothetical protein K493DRAFT_360072 [Basidiobolus meristosporus CBS 931.73]
MSVGTPEAVLEPDSIQIRGGKQEIDQRLHNFIHVKRREIDESNRIEFLKQYPSTQGADTCARTDAVKLNRSLQMKIDVVNNDWGPLMRSMQHATNESARKIKKTDMVTLSTGVEERLRAIEEHFNIKPGRLSTRREDGSGATEENGNLDATLKTCGISLTYILVGLTPSTTTSPTAHPSPQTEQRSDEAPAKPLFKRVGRGKDSSLARCVEEQLRKMELKKRTGVVSMPDKPEAS